MKKAMLISCFCWYDARLKPIKELLEEEYDVSSYTSDYIHTLKTYIDEKDKNSECTYIHVPSYKKNLSLKRFWSYICFGRKVGKEIHRKRPDLIYLLLPPNNIAHYCTKFKAKYPNTQYYVDIIDLWPESMPIKDAIKHSRIFKQWGALRDKAVIKADHVFIECDLYRDVLKTLNQDSSTTLYLYRDVNADLEREVSKCIESKKTSQGNSISICYLGSINHLIDIDSIQELFTLLIDNNMTVDFKVIGDGEAKEQLLSMANEAGVKATYYGKIYDQSKKIELIGECDYGINMMKSGVSVGLSIKSVDYLSMGIPLINNIQGDTWGLVEKCNIGVNWLDDKKRVLEHLVNNNPYEMSKNALACFSTQFTREAFKKKVRKVLQNKKSITISHKVI